jgi:hypothetical protein
MQAIVSQKENLKHSKIVALSVANNDKKMRITYSASIAESPMSAVTLCSKF